MPQDKVGKYLKKKFKDPKTPEKPKKEKKDKSLVAKIKDRKKYIDSIE